jgi:hypothetical protein
MLFRTANPLRRRRIFHHPCCGLVEVIVLLARNVLDQSLDDLIALHALGFGVEVGDDAMAEHGQCDLANVLSADVIPPLQQRPGFAGEDQILAGPWPRAPADVFVHEIRAAAFGFARQAGESHDPPPAPCAPLPVAA